MGRTPKSNENQKDKNMNVKFPAETYNELQQVAKDLGGMSLSAMVRMLILSRLQKVKSTKNPKDFLDL